MGKCSTPAGSPVGQRAARATPARCPLRTAIHQPAGTTSAPEIRPARLTNTRDVMGSPPPRRTWRPTSAGPQSQRRPRRRTAPRRPRWPPARSATACNNQNRFYCGGQAGHDGEIPAGRKQPSDLDWCGPAGVCTWRPNVRNSDHHRREGGAGEPNTCRNQRFEVGDHVPGPARRWRPRGYRALPAGRHQGDQGGTGTVPLNHRADRYAASGWQRHISLGGPL